MFCDGLFAFMSSWRILLRCIASSRYHPLFEEIILALNLWKECKRHSHNRSKKSPLKKCIDLY
jgi:hypothetical protein